MKLSTFGLEVLFLTSVTEVLSVLRECKDFVPPGEEKWYDTEGEDCLWYRDGDSCEVFTGRFMNFGQDAASACCTCGGGTNLETPVECTDYVPPGEEKWVDGYNSDCAGYEDPTNYWWCLESGKNPTYANFGKIAREVCCFCGGGIEGRQTPPAAAKKPFKIEDDGRDFASEVKKVLEPYIPVEVVPKGATAHLKVDWKEKDSAAGIAGYICETGGATFTWPFDIANPKRSFPQMIKEVIKELLLYAGNPIRKGCDAGYRYSGLEEISCCTADLLNTLDDCIKGKQVKNPPCWSPPVTTPVPGKTKLVKVKILVNPQLAASQDWTEEKSLRELEMANRMIAATAGIEEDVRFVMYKQMERRIEATSATAVYDSLVSLADGDPEKDAYNGLLYLTQQPLIRADGARLAGRADPGLCYSRPSVAIADPIASRISAPHELAHWLGADHGMHCQGYFIASALTGFGDVDLGLDECNANRVAQELPKYSCLETAP